MLQLCEVSVRYGGAPVAVQAVSTTSFTIYPGEAVGLLGESGCGKSTLARTILGLLPPGAHAEGRIRFQDKELTSATEDELCSIRGGQIALISQDPAQSLNPVLTIGVQVAEVLRSHVRLPGAERSLRAIETLRSVGFSNPETISRRYAHQLSGGERQRAAIAQAIACRPALLIADEATSKLDVRLKSELLELFGALRAQYGMALLFISHEPGAVAAVTQRLIVMYAGEIVETGPTASVLREPLHPYTQALVQLARERSAIHSGKNSRRFTVIEGEASVAQFEDCCYFERRCAKRMAACAARHPIVSQYAGHDVRCLIYE